MLLCHYCFVKSNIFLDNIAVASVGCYCSNGKALPANQGIYCFCVTLWVRGRSCVIVDDGFRGKPHCSNNTMPRLPGHLKRCNRSFARCSAHRRWLSTYSVPGHVEKPRPCQISISHGGAPDRLTTSAIRNSSSWSSP